MKLISIITVNYNQSNVTEQLLESIFQKNKYKNIEFIVVDNGSENDPTYKWKSKYPNIQFIRSDKNLGFAGGNNLGMQVAKGDYLFLVNNDTEFTENLVENLASTLEKQSDVGIISPKILYYDQPTIIQYAGFTNMNYYTIRNKCIGQYEKDLGQYDNKTGPTGFIHGAAMMVRRRVIEKAGMMEENYFLYYEEMDWCEKIKRAGYAIWINTQAVILHKESISVGKKSTLKEYFMNRNRILFARRNASVTKRQIFYVYFIGIVTPRNILKYIKNKQYEFIKILFKAIEWNITHSINSNHLGYPIK